MGLLSLVRGSSASDSNRIHVVAQYQRLRGLRLHLNNELVQRLSKEVLHEGARKLGMLRGNVFVFNHEVESSVLMDYCIYNVFQNGHNAVEQYLADCPPQPDSDEMICLLAMQRATYALVAVLGVERGVGCHVRNLFTEEEHLLVDMGLSQTAERGALMATRLLDFGDYLATGGAAIPVGVLDDAGLDDWQRQLRAGVEENRFDPAALIRKCLSTGATSHIRYEEPGTLRQPNVQKASIRAENPAERKRELAVYKSTKAGPNQRCRCGSGKMYKNCCGKVSANDDLTTA